MIQHNPKRAMRVSRGPARAALCLAGARATTESSDSDEGAKM